MPTLPLSPQVVMTSTLGRPFPCSSPLMPCVSTASVGLLHHLPPDHSMERVISA